MDKIKGTIFVIFAAVVFGCIPLFSKIAFSNGFNEMTFVLGRCFFATLFIYVYTKIAGLKLIINKKYIFAILKISFIGYGVMLYTLVSSYRYMPTGIATSIHFIYPLAVMIGGAIFYKEKISFSKIIVLIIAFLGIFFIAGFKKLEDISFLGFLLAFGSGILFAYYILTIGNGYLRKVNSLKLIFYVYFLNIFFFFFACLFRGNFNLDITHKGFYYMLLISFLSLLGMISFKKGLEKINTVTASILSTFEPLTSLLIGVIFLKEILLIHHIIGSLLIIIAVIFTSFIENKEQNDIKLKIKVKEQ